jgi:hypothetical protein
MALDESTFVRTDLAYFPWRTATAYNSFALCEAYIGSSCSDKESIGETNGFSLRLLRGGDKKRRCEDVMMLHGPVERSRVAPFQLKPSL